MATVTKTFTENREEYYRATWTFTLTGNNVNATGSTVFVPVPTITAKYVYSGKNSGYAQVRGSLSVNGVVSDDLVWQYDGSNRGWPSNTTRTISPIWDVGYNVNTSSIFSAANKTTREVGVYLVPSVQYPLYFYGTSNYTEDYGSSYQDNEFEDTTLSSVGPLFSVVLNVPPTFNETFSYTGDFSGVPYANLTTASVSLSNLAAYYGGDFSGVGNAEFIIGSQSVSKPNPVNGDVLSIALNAVGTFTPTVKITDSRGQVTTHTLSAITVMGYNAPTVSFDASRTLSDGTPDDEGTYAFIEAMFTFTDVIADAVAPSVVVTDDAGTVTTPVVSWYTDAGLTTPVTWSSLSSGDTVYGIFSGLSTQHSYTVSIRPRDSEGTGTAVTQTIGAAFYTVDFLAGGHGIAFGKPAANVGFECAMTALFEDTLQADGAATFEDTLQADGTATFGSDVLIDLPEYTTANTTDKAIYDAVVVLGWDSDVLVN